MNIVLVLLIVSFFALTVFALVAMIILQRQKVKSSAEVIAELDKALDAALTEINNLGSLVQKELEEKHQTMLFLYDLVEEKHKEISEVSDSAIIAEMSELMEQYIKTHGLKSVSVVSDSVDEVQDFDELADDTEDFDSADSFYRKRPSFANSRHEQIWDLREEGRNVSEIAKELGMGQGEVKLILDLADRAS